MTNKKLGNDFESEFCEILANHGFWVHLLTQNSAGQPADVIAVKNGKAYLIDCKHCAKDKNNLAGVEIYKSARYFIMTGDTLLYRTIEENQEAIDYVVEKYFPETRQEKETSDFGSRIYSPIWELPENNRIKLRPVYPRIPDGSRNICLTSLAGMLHNQGYGEQALAKRLRGLSDLTGEETSAYSR